MRFCDPTRAWCRRKGDPVTEPGDARVSTTHQGLERPLDALAGQGIPPERIHPFTDGNGRTTRLLADLVFAAAQDPTEWQYDWNVAKPRYIELLRAFDSHRNAAELADFIGAQPIES
jgi:fido (protein-threonine AMPylation protein)